MNEIIISDLIIIDKIYNRMKPGFYVYNDDATKPFRYSEDEDVLLKHVETTLCSNDRHISYYKIEHIDIDGSSSIFRWDTIEN